MQARPTTGTWASKVCMLSNFKPDCENAWCAILNLIVKMHGVQF